MNETEYKRAKHALFEERNHEIEQSTEEYFNEEYELIEQAKTKHWFKRQLREKIDNLQEKYRLLEKQIRIKYALKDIELIDEAIDREYARKTQE